MAEMPIYFRGAARDLLGIGAAAFRASSCEAFGFDDDAEGRCRLPAADTGAATIRGRRWQTHDGLYRHCATPALSLDACAGVQYQLLAAAPEFSSAIYALSFAAGDRGCRLRRRRFSRNYRFSDEFTEACQAATRCRCSRRPRFATISEICAAGRIGSMDSSGPHC